jgi:hypothetical protein
MASRGVHAALVGALIVLGVCILAAAVACLVPLAPCPSCVDLLIHSVKCDICGGRGPRENNKLTLWKRWEAIRRLEKEGCRPMPLIPHE